MLTRIVSGGISVSNGDVNHVMNIFSIFIKAKTFGSCLDFKAADEHKRESTGAGWMQEGKLTHSTSTAMLPHDEGTCCLAGLADVF